MAKEKIIIKGSSSYAGKEYDVDSTVIIQLTDGFYHKNDTASVARVNGRFYRVNSPLIVEAHRDHKNFFSERFILKEEAAPYDGAYVRKDDLTTISVIDDDAILDVAVLSYVTNEVYNSSNFVMEDGSLKKLYYKSAGAIQNHFVVDELQRSYVSKNHPELKKATSLGLSNASNRFHIDSPDLSARIEFLKNRKNVTVTSKEVYTLLEDHLIKDEDGMFTKRSYLSLWNGEDKKIRLDKLVAMTYEDRIKAIDDMFHETEIISFREAKTASSFAKSISNAIVIKKIVYKNSDKPSSSYSNILRSYTDIVPEDIMNTSDYKKYKRALDEITSSIKTGSLGSQPSPLFLCNNIGNQGGNYLFHEARNRSLEVSPTRLMTGGIGYTFGVELETSYGVLPKSLIEYSGCKAVGDRSIGALEYVTKPLHGDKGMTSLLQLVNDLGNFTHVDYKCGLHVHVGGSRMTDSPVFNRRFSIYAIKLGLQVQDEMFSIMPTHRLENKNRDGIPYCGKIESVYQSISTNNWREMLGLYVYGRPFDADNNSKSRLFRWIPSRYKWLNLVNCNSDNGGRSDAGSNERFSTIEFRIFEGTLNSIDVQNFVLLSLAFTKFVDCHQGLIEKGGVDLEKIIRKTLDKSAVEPLLEWIRQRKAINK